MYFSPAFRKKEKIQKKLFVKVHNWMKACLKNSNKHTINF